MTAVFISYRHETPDHKDRVRDFAERLQAAGIEVILDQFQPAGGPMEGWDVWSERQAAWVENENRPRGAADRILIVGSRGWFSCYEGTDTNSDAGFGATREALVIQQILIRTKGRADLVRMVYFGELLDGQIPAALRDLPRFDVSRPERFDEIATWLSAPAHKLPPRIPWPQEPPDLMPWELTHADEVRAACAKMLTHEPPQRILRIESPAGPERSKVTKVLYLRAAKAASREAQRWLKVGRLDLKGGTNLEVELEGFARELGCKDILRFQPNLTESRLLSRIFEKLEECQVPTLLIFDSIEQEGEIQDWVNRIALGVVPDAQWLRIVAAGHETPQPDGEAWGEYAGEPIRLAPIASDDVGTAHEPATRDSGAAALASLDRAFAQRSESDRAALKAALVAAAVPHWCDSRFLAALLDEPLRNRSSELLASLRTQPGVEPFPARGPDAFYVADSIRGSLRQMLVRDDPARLRELASRAAAFLEEGTSRTQRIERIYHRLVAEGDAAADDAEKMDADFWHGYGHRDHPVYVAALHELIAEGSIQGRALIEALLSDGFFASKRNRYTEALELAARARHAATTMMAHVQANAFDAAPFRWAEARTYCIEGEILTHQRNIPAAQAAYGKYREIMLEAVAAVPDRARFQTELAVAESRVGTTAKSLGETDEALALFQSARARQEALVAANPQDDALRRTAAILRGLEIDILVRQGRKQGGLATAIVAIRELVEICRELTGRDPDNPLWLGDLCCCTNQLGDVLFTIGNAADALGAYRDCLAAAERWMQRDPIQFGPGDDGESPSEAAYYHQISQGRIASILIQLGRLGEARQFCDAHFAACAKAAARAGTNLDCQFSLGLANYYFGEFHRVQDHAADALSAYGEALRIYELILARQPSMAVWRGERLRVLGLIGDCHRQRGNAADARRSFEAQLAAAEEMLTSRSDNLDLQRQIVAAHMNLGDLAGGSGDLLEMKRHYEAARADAEKLAAMNPDNSFLQRELVRALMRIACVLVHDTDILNALACTQKACKILEKLSDSQPTDPCLRKELALGRSQMAELLERHGNFPAANDERKRAAQILEDMARNSEMDGLADSLSITASEQSAVLAAREGNPAIAMEKFRVLLEAAEGYLASHPNIEAAQSKVAQVQYRLAELTLQQAALDKAETLYRQSGAGWQELHRIDPARVEWRHNASLVHARLADIAVYRQNFAAAEPEFVAASEGMEESVAKMPGNLLWQRDLVMVRYRYAEMLRQRGDDEAALGELTDCSEHLATIEGVRDPGRQVVRDLAQVEQLKGDTLFRLARWGDAEAAYGRAFEHARALLRAAPDDAAAQDLVSAMEARIGTACQAGGRFEEARLYFDKRRAFLEEVMFKTPEAHASERELGRIRSELGTVCANLGEYDEAFEHRREAIRIFERLVDLYPAQHVWLNDLATEHNQMALLLSGQGHHPAAFEHAEFAFDAMQRAATAQPNIALYRANAEVMQKNLEILRP